MMRQCAMYSFVSQVQEQRLGWVMRIDNIHCLVCEEIGTVVSPLIKERAEKERKFMFSFLFLLFHRKLEVRLDQIYLGS